MLLCLLEAKDTRIHHMHFTRHAPFSGRIGARYCSVVAHSELRWPVSLHLLRLRKYQTQP